MVFVAKPLSNASGFFNVLPPAVQDMKLLFDIPTDFEEHYDRTTDSKLKDVIALLLIQLVGGNGGFKMPALKSLTLSVREGIACFEERASRDIAQSCKEAGVSWTIKEAGVSWSIETSE